ncbi:hypothetical protein C0991_012050 [Blastosporella zonata]|nr:hypothetical protein C0991_012050 [Blastosporella zonata]
MPGYFRFVTLLAFHVFLSLKVDATVLEVGVGGTYDSTNIVPKPIVTGVTALGIDHVTVLGKTLEEIAWQKGGIFKEGAPAITVNQPSEGLYVLQERAKELKVSVMQNLTTVAISEDDLAQLKTQRELASAWSSLVPDFPPSQIHVLPSIEHAVNEIEKLQGPAPVKVLVAGSLHLVGGAIEVSGLSSVAL